MKRLKNIEGKNEEQLKMIENKESKQLGIKSVTDIFDEELSQEIKDILKKPNNLKKSINYKKLICKRNRSLGFNFRDFKSFKRII